MVKSIFIAKYVIFVVVVVSAGLVIERFTRIRNISEPAKFLAKDLVYNVSAPFTFNKADLTLKTHYLKCILNPSKPFCRISADKRRELFQKEEKPYLSDVEVIENKLENVTTYFKKKRLYVYKLMEDFISIISAVNVRAFIIEPSILFCMLPQKQKYVMLSTGFNPSQLEGSSNVVTFGVFEEDSRRLNGVNLTESLLAAGFKITKIQKWLKPRPELQDQSERFDPVHYFFSREDMTIHVVVFFNRNMYLWIGGLESEDIGLEDLLFAKDHIFENFTIVKVLGPSLGKISNKVFIPYHVQYFLKETKTAEFVKCHVNGVPNLEYPSLPVDHFDVRVAIALRELKTALIPQMVVFWLWSQSYLGWFQQGNILQYSETLHLALSSKDVEALNLTQILSGSSFLTVSNDSSQDFYYLLDCRGLQIHLTVLHEERGELWTKYNNGENVYRLQYPSFSICSTDIYGQKENVPCDTDFMTPKEGQNWVDPGNLTRENGPSFPKIN